ncbi:MAG: hypothetical protein GY862_15395, partial [Gammaproteobacteria bacterium]|nr:hypothetical protein [Gammaproteobacteria bacterium]
MVFGTTVTLLNVDTDEEVTCQIVGEDEADIKARLISITSPTARALIGKEPRRTGFATPSGIFVLQAGVMKKRFGAGYKPAPAGIAAFGISNVEGSVRIA